MRAVYEAVKRYGSIAGAQEDLKEPYKTIAEIYRRARRELKLPEVRTEARALHAMGLPYAGQAENKLALELPITDGVIVGFGDAHWRSLKQGRSLAHEGLLNLLPILRPTHLFAMGDMVDLSAASRHDPLMWEDRTTVEEEVGAAQTHMGEIGDRAPDAARIWIRGNHDDRYDKFLAKHAPQFGGIKGTRFDDHFPEWEMNWRVDVPGVLVAFHVWHRGVHAAYNNTVKAGISTMTGDTHQLTIRPHNDFTGRRWGIEAGTLADPNWPQFRYTLGQTQRAAPGFVVLTISNGRLLTPEPAEVVDDACWFRGSAIAGRARARAGSIR